jgi:hypothetical protein
MVEQRRQIFGPLVTWCRLITAEDLRKIAKYPVAPFPPPKANYSSTTIMTRLCINMTVVTGDVIRAEAVGAVMKGAIVFPHIYVN